MTNKIMTNTSTKESSSDEVVSFGAVVQKYRVKKNLSQPELAKLLGASRNTITNWETDKSFPSASAIRELTQILGIPLYELFGMSDHELPSSHENNLLREYRRLSRMGQKVIDKMIGTILQEEADAHDSYLIENYFLLPLEATPAAAGSGCAFVEIPPEYCFVKKNGYNESADALISVSGASMEPLYHNGDLVYMKYASSANDGDDVICSTADGAVIKRISGRKLYSLNKALPFGEKSEDDHVTILGIVLGIVSPDELPDEEERLALEEVKYQEVIQFNQEHGRE